MRWKTKSQTLEFGKNDENRKTKSMMKMNQIGRRKNKNKNEIEKRNR
jgi:hypothetical protein